MSLESGLAFLLFALASSITPGPNNILLMASGLAHGFRATVPHILGVSAGFALLMLGVGLGLKGIFLRFPQLHEAMKYLGAIYFVYFSWKLASAPVKPVALGNQASGVWRFRDGLAFQCVNPKGWVMALGVFSSYVPASGSSLLACGVAISFVLIAMPCFALWTLFGSRLRAFLDLGSRRRIFNVGMASLLLSSLMPIFFSSV